MITVSTHKAFITFMQSANKTLYFSADSVLVHSGSEQHWEVWAANSLFSHLPFRILPEKGEQKVRRKSFWEGISSIKLQIRFGEKKNIACIGKFNVTLTIHWWDSYLGNSSMANFTKSVFSIFAVTTCKS